MKRKKPYPVGVGMVPCKNAFGALLRQRRLKLELTQTDMAERIKLALSDYGKLERGDKGHYLRPAIVKRVAEVLACTATKVARMAHTFKTHKPQTKLAEFLRACREKRGWSIAQTAKRCGVTEECVRRREYKNRCLSPSSARSVALAFGLPYAVVATFLQKYKQAKRPATARGKRIRAWRKARGWSLQNLADQIGVTRQYVGWIELTPHSIRESTLKKLIQALRIPTKLASGCV